MGFISLIVSDSTFDQTVDSSGTHLSFGLLVVFPASLRFNFLMGSLGA